MAEGGAGGGDRGVALVARGAEQTRLRAGPFDSRESAERARDKLKSLGIPVGQVTSR